MADESSGQTLTPPILWGLAVGIALLLFLVALFLDAVFAVLIALILFAVLAFAERSLLARALGLLTVLIAVLEYTDPERMFGSWTLVMVMGLVALLAFAASTSS